MKIIKKRAIKFLEKIKDNNNREWFLENKSEYLEIKKELEIFSAHWHSELMKFDDSLRSIDCKPYMFRIYRDARFAKGKPYKQNYGLFLSEWWKPAMHNKAGYFLNIEPWNNFLVWWAWLPEPEWLKNMRNNISENPSEIKKVLNNKNFKKYFELKWKQLKTVPRWYSKDHPELELLRYKDFVAFHNFSDKEILADDFLYNLVSMCKVLYPFDEYLNKFIKK